MKNMYRKDFNMQDFQYEIMSVDKKQRWIFMHADEWDSEEPDAFVYLVRKIKDDLKGRIIDRGMTSYQIDNDPCHLTYQWDTCLGITIIYPEDVSGSEAIAFLKKYL